MLKGFVLIANENLGYDEWYGNRSGSANYIAPLESETVTWFRDSYPPRARVRWGGVLLGRLPAAGRLTA